MPPLQRPEHAKRVALPARRAIVAGEADVLVVGGGPAGLAAALGAADAGASVILAERYGFLGGNATAALVMPLMSFHTHSSVRRQPKVRLFPDDHGPGHAVIGGVLQRLLTRLIEANGAMSPSLATGYTVPFDPEWFKLVALDLLDEAGVRFLFHAFASGVEQENAERGVVFETKSGPLVVRAQVVVDCTGDGDIAALAGAPYEIGRDNDHLAQPMTLMFRMVGFDGGAFDAYADAHPDQWRGVHGLWDLIREATEAGELNLPREDMLFFGTPHADEVSVNSTRVTCVLGTDVWDWTRAEWLARRQMREIVNFLRRRVPGFEHSRIVQSGVHAGVRETRRIRGDYTLTAKDILGARQFDDVVAQGAYPIDIHNPEGPGTVMKHLPANKAYDIPLRALFPRGLERVLVAGRCISGTHEAHSSYRVMPICMATGQAAGVCAALAASKGVVPRQVGVRAVQDALRAQGAILTDQVA